MGIEEYVQDPIKQQLLRRQASSLIEHKSVIQQLRGRRENVRQPLDLQKRILHTLKKQGQIEPTLDVASIYSDYFVTIQDESIVNPFIISPALVRIIKKNTQHCTTKESIAENIFEWMENNIEYGKSQRYQGYKNSKEVLNDKEGVCGEMAFVYVCMSRVCGLQSAYVSVTKDYRGKNVHHACAVVDTGHKDVYVDPAYHVYDIHHQKTQVLSDLQVLEKFNSWRTLSK